jgi:Ice-binding-like
MKKHTVLEVLQLEDRTVPSVLGLAANFAILAGSTITNTGPTVVQGNIGLNPGTSVTGFPPGTVVNGTIDTSGDAVLIQAKLDLSTAYNTLVGEVPTTDLTGQGLGGLTLTPGIYHFNTSAQLTGTLTLDAQGDPNARFDFQIGSTLTTAAASKVNLINGANGDNVYWQVGSSATIAVNTIFAGNIVALTSITLVHGASITSGRALAENGAVTMDTNMVFIPLAENIGGGGDNHHHGDDDFNDNDDHHGRHHRREDDDDHRHRKDDDDRHKSDDAKHRKDGSKDCVDAFFAELSNDWNTVFQPVID